MRIKTLNLIAFGKFQNKVIELSDEFNLVFGGNEAGKSTIQHFIEGMLFGFYKPYRKKRTYNDDYYRFKPRYSDRYCGAMIYEDDQGREIRVERDFLKARDGVTIYDNVTGEDISGEYPYDSVTKQYLPMGNTKVNAIVYNNTANVKQMASRSEAELAKEVNNRLVDAAADSGDDLSVSKAMAYLEECKKNVGTVGQSRSNYGAAVRELDTLENILKESEEIYDRVYLNQKKIQQCRKKIEQLNERYDGTKAKLIAQAEESRRALDEKLDEIRAEGEDLEYQLKMLESHGEVDYHTLGDLQAKDSQVVSLGLRMQEYDRKVADCEAQLTVFQDQLNDVYRVAGSYTPEAVLSDYELYCQAKATMPLITKNEAADARPPKKGAVVPMVIGILIGALLLIAGMINYNDLFTYPVQIAVCAIGGICIIGSIFVMVVRIKFPPDQNEEDDEDDAEAEYSSGIIENLMEKYGVRSENALVKILEGSEERLEGYHQCEAEVRRLNIIRDQIRSEKSKTERRKTELEQEIAAVLKEARVPDIEGYKEACDDNEKMSTIRTKLDANRRLYAELSKNENAANAGGGADMTLENNELLRLKDVIETNHMEMAKIVGENNSLMNGVGSPVEIRERIETLKGEIQEYESEIKACDMAESFFRNFSRSQLYDQASDMNQKIGGIIGGITHKYTEAKVDENLNIRVVDPESQTLVAIDQLSGGTVDQIYLALRFGVIDLLNLDVNLPIILDDSFVQYDEDRKADAIRYLVQLAGQTQIILFTCTTDEKRILDAEGHPYIGIGI